MQNPFIVEKVKCCICGGGGKVRHLLLFRKSCNVCDGTGMRMILVPRRATPELQAEIRATAQAGVFAPSLLESIAGQALKGIF